MTYYIVSLSQGILTFISPCILPLLPVYLFYLAGKKSEKQKNSLIFNSIAFVIGFSIIFTLLGATATVIGSFFKSNEIIFRRISGILMILIGLNFLEIVKIPFLNKEKGLDANKKAPNFISSIIFGMMFAFAWSPCLTAFLGNILILASNQDTVSQGITLLLFYSLGLGIPFIITALLYDKLVGAFNFIKRHYRIIKIISGALMIIAGGLVFFDIFKYILI